MAARRKTSRKSTPRRTSSGPRRKTTRRRNTLNASTKKKLAGLGLAAGVATVAVPVVVGSVKARSFEPMVAAATNPGLIKSAAMRGIGGYIGGTVAGMVIDKTGLKRPVNKALKLVGMR